MRGLGIHCHSFWFMVKGKKIWLLPPDKNTEESSRPENDFFFPFLSFFCCYLSLPDWSALHSPSVWAAQKRLLRQRIGGGRKEKWKRPLDWRHGVWEEEAQWQEQCCFGLRSLRQIRRSCGRSETLSLEAAVVNTLAWFRSWGCGRFSVLGNMSLMSCSDPFSWKWRCGMEKGLEGNTTTAVLSTIFALYVHLLCVLIE